MKIIRLSLAVAALSCVAAVNAQSLFRSSLPVAKPAKGITVAGTVECDGAPVAGVVVSDGYEVTKTDRKGAYYLASRKQNPQVFITSPSGYEVWRDDAVPQFWADFTEPADKFERHDFRLRKTGGAGHAVIVITDVHLANQRGDVATFAGPYTETVRREADSLRATGKEVYTINLGDATWDQYWYAHGYPVASFRKTLADCGLPTAVYSVMGNHDNDATVTGDDVDFRASLPYQKAFGPRYYSQNIGGVHYVFLDNVTYRNEPAGSEVYKDVFTKRNYTEGFSPEQLAWLRKDLAEVPYDMPLILSMHCPMLRWTALSGNPRLRRLTDDIQIKTEPESTLELLEILKPYKTVHSLCGHSHKQCLVRLPGDMQNLTEHNISGTCGSWWRTRSTAMKNLCPDGTPTAYEVLTVDGPEIRWDHRAFEYPASRQFFAWDMNRVRDYFATDGEMRAFLTLYPRWDDYSTLPDNYVYVNLWAWDPEGRLSVIENGRELDVEMVVEQNPMYVAGELLRQTVWQNAWDKSGYQKPRKFQLFRAKASAPDTPVDIVWKDRFGRETRQTLVRPADFEIEKL